MKTAKINVTFPMTVPLEYDEVGRVIHPVASFGKYFDEYFIELQNHLNAHRFKLTKEVDYDDIGEKTKAYMDTEVDLRVRQNEEAWAVKMEHFNQDCLRLVGMDRVNWERLSSPARHEILEERGMHQYGYTFSKNV